MKTWIQSLSCKKLQPRRLTVDMVGSIEEIAHSLSGNFRFTRQTHQRYSVAQHCVQGSHLLRPVFASAFLLHELSEVYLADCAGPMKPFGFWEVTDCAEAWSPNEVAFHVGEEGRGGERTFISWSTLERQHTRTMLEALGLISLEPLIYSPEVKAMDCAMLRAEKEQLCGEPPEPWGIESVEPAKVNVAAWASDAAETAFLSRFHELFGAR